MTYPLAKDTFYTRYGSTILVQTQGRLVGQ